MKGKKVTQEVFERANAMKEKGFSTKWIADTLGYGISTIGKLVSCESLEEYRYKASVSYAKEQPEITQTIIAVDSKEELLQAILNRLDRICNGLGV